MTLKKAAPRRLLSGGEAYFLFPAAASAAALAAASAALRVAPPLPDMLLPVPVPVDVVGLPLGVVGVAPVAEAGEGAAAGAGAGATVVAGAGAAAGAGAGAGASVLLQAPSATAAIRLARRCSFFIDVFLGAKVGARMSMSPGPATSIRSSVPDRTGWPARRVNRCQWLQAPRARVTVRAWSRERPAHSWPAIRRGSRAAEGAVAARCR